jgi:hypothetical protein
MNPEFIDWVMENKIEVTDHYTRFYILDFYDETKIYSMYYIKMELISSKNGTHIETICTTDSNIGLSNKHIQMKL